jgi:hypothetical protein
MTDKPNPYDVTITYTQENECCVNSIYAFSLLDACEFAKQMFLDSRKDIVAIVNVEGETKGEKKND